MPQFNPPDRRQLTDPEPWCRALVILSNCLKHPDGTLRYAITDGTLAADLGDTMFAIGLEEPSSPPPVENRDLTEDYESLFGAFRRPFAPPAASPYKEWYGESKQGLMDGPPATRMKRRYDAIEASIPEAYPPDHVALELEYASLLTESDKAGELAVFIETDLDWIDAFAEMVSEAVAEAPFYRWCVDVLLTVVQGLRTTLQISDPSAETTERMTERARSSVT